MSCLTFMVSCGGGGEGGFGRKVDFVANAFIVPGSVLRSLNSISISYYCNICYVFYE